MKDIGIGVIGLGMGRNALGINAVDDSRLGVVALCDTNRARLEDAASRHGVPTVTDDYRSLIANPDVAVVAVYSPDHLHAEQALVALNAGKHVICTKPMVTSYADACRIRDLSERRGLKFLVGQTCRFVPHFAEAARLAETGALGRLLFAEAHYVHDMRPVLTATPWRHEAPQDLVFGGACHPIDLLVWILGEVAEVSAMGQRSGMDARYPAHLHDNFLINLRFTNGTVGRVLATYGMVEPPMPMLGLSIFGTKGSVVQERVRFDGDETRPLEIAHEAGHANEVIRYLRHFEDCLLNDREPMINARVGAQVMRVCEAVWASVRSGRTVGVDEIPEPPTV